MAKSARWVAVLGGWLGGLLGATCLLPLALPPPPARAEAAHEESRSQSTSSVTAADGTTTTTITETVTTDGRTSTTRRTVVSRPGDPAAPEPPTPPTPPAAAPRPSPMADRVAPPKGNRDSAGLAREAVAAHNRERQKHGVGDLTWEPKLAALADSWAHHLCRSGRQPPMLQHRPPVSGGPGENLWEAVTTEATRYPIGEAVQSWASEQQYYDERSGRCKGGTCGHYTQLVWRTTRQVGCAVATCPAGGFAATVWVCNYAPAGNFVNERPY